MTCACAWPHECLAAPTHHCHQIHVKMPLQPCACPLPELWIPLLTSLGPSPSQNRQMSRIMPCLYRTETNPTVCAVCHQSRWSGRGRRIQCHPPTPLLLCAAAMQHLLGKAESTSTCPWTRSALSSGRPPHLRTRRQSALLPEWSQSFVDAHRQMDLEAPPDCLWRHLSVNYIAQLM